jgi:hypothetical protein
VGGRQFGARNKEAPACVAEIAKQVPACFSAVQWLSYVDDCYRSALNDPAERARMDRGQAPNHCVGCTVGYRERMRGEGRCFPHAQEAEVASA